MNWKTPLFILVALVGGVLGGVAYDAGRPAKPVTLTGKEKTDVKIKEVEAPTGIEAPVFVEAKPLPLRPKTDPVVTIDGKGREFSTALSEQAQFTADYTRDTYQGKEVLVHSTFAKAFKDEHGECRENVAWGGPGYDWEQIYPVWHGSTPHQYNWTVGGRYMGYGKATAKNGVTYFVVIYAEKP